MSLALLVAGLFICGYISASTAGHGDFERRAAKQIKRLCGKREDCVVSLHDVVPGDWDTLDYFGNSTASDVEKELGVPIQASDSMGVIVVLLRAGKVVAVETPDQGVESSLDNAVHFYCPKKDDLVMLCRSNSLMRVTRQATNGDPARGMSIAGFTYTLTTE